MCTVLTDRLALTNIPISTTIQPQMTSKRLRRGRGVPTLYSTASAPARTGRPSPPRALPRPLPFRTVRSQLDSSSTFKEPFMASDRRTYIPAPFLPRGHASVSPGWALQYQAPRRISGRPARVVAPPVQTNKQTNKGVRLHNPAALLFAAPERVVACVQRKTRKEVIHAKGIAGGKTAPPRRTPTSNIRC